VVSARVQESQDCAAVAVDCSIQEGRVAFCASEFGVGAALDEVVDAVYGAECWNGRACGCPVCSRDERGIAMVVSSVDVGTGVEKWLEVVGVIGVKESIVYG
jgi:hypothetical protein